jgi:hypothetical protein
MYNLNCYGDMIFIEKSNFNDYMKSESTLLSVMQVEVEFEDAYYQYVTEKYKSSRRSIVYIYHNDCISNYDISIEDY